MFYLSDIGKYFIMIKMSFFKPSKWKILKKLIFKEINDLIIESIPIVAILSFFIGAVISIQTAMNLSSPFLEKSLIVNPDVIINLPLFCLRNLLLKSDFFPK